MGFPQGYTGALQPHKGVDQRDARKSALGNSFHVPSIALLLVLLLAPALATDPLRSGTYGVPAPTGEQRASWRRKHAANTPWAAPEPLLDTRAVPADTLMAKALARLPADAVKPGRVAAAVAAVAHLCLRPLFTYEEHLETSGAPDTLRGPDLQALYFRGSLLAATGGRASRGPLCEPASRSSRNAWAKKSTTAERWG